MNTFNQKLTPWAIFLILSLIYLKYPTKNYYWDGITFAQTIENASSLNSSLIHPNHLIYNIAGYLLYKCALNIEPSVRALTVLQVSNSVLSALSAALLFQILKTSLRSVYLAVVSTLIFSFSATWWRFSTDADAYVPSVLFLLASFYLALPNHKPRPFLIALTHTVSMIFHQLAVFFFPVIALGIFLQTSSLALRGRRRSVVQYWATASLLTVTAFHICFYLQTGSLSVRDFAKWLTSYSPEIGFVFNLKDSLAYTLRGNIRLFFGGRLNFLKEVLNPLTIFLTTALLFACVAFIIQLIRKPKGNRLEKETTAISPAKDVVALCIVWASFYLTFLFFWIPQHTFYRLFYLPPLIALIGVFLKRYNTLDTRRWRGALFVVILALYNFLFLVYPYAQVRENTPLSLTLKMNNVWSPNTVIYFHRQNPDNELIRYFNPATMWKKLESFEMEEFENELQQVYANGAAAWLETSALQEIARTPEGKQWLTVHSGDQSQYKLTDPAYNVNLVQIFPRAETPNKVLPQ